MKTNLIFKRQITVDGRIQTVTKIIPVDVPHIDSGEGWVLSGHTDIIEVLNSVPVHSIPATTVSKENSDVVKFTSDIPGTAKLVRTKNTIKIVARKGKTTFNQTTRNSVCIDDLTKCKFFNSCRDYYGISTSTYYFKSEDKNPYDYWNAFIDKEYTAQRARYINKLN